MQHDLHVQDYRLWQEMRERSRRNTMRILLSIATGGGGYTQGYA